MKKSNDNNALARSQRELFVGIRDFIAFKFKRMVVFNGVRDFTKMRFLSIELEKCENIKIWKNYVIQFIIKAQSIF